jgi:hypothetical protein
VAVGGSGVAVGLGASGRGVSVGVGVSGTEDGVGGSGVAVAGARVGSRVATLKAGLAVFVGSDFGVLVGVAVGVGAIRARKLGPQARPMRQSKAPTVKSFIRLRAISETPIAILRDVNYNYN